MKMRNPFKRMAQSRTLNAKSRSGEEGFSLTEIMVAVFIMGLLSAVVAVNVFPLLFKGRVTSAQTNIAKLQEAVYSFKVEIGRFPTEEEGLNALITPPQGLNQPDRYRKGGYLLVKNLPLDPWGNEYQYRIPGENAEFDIYSFGADGRPGGEDENADIGNWN